MLDEEVKNFWVSKDIGEHLARLIRDQHQEKFGEVP
jgi:hypothetical protein